MKSKICCFLLGIFVSTVVWISSTNVHSASAQAPAFTKIVALGDSITYGWGVGADGYVYRIAADLNLPLINHAVNGATTSQIRDQATTYTADMNGALVIVTAGANDIWYNKPLCDAILNLQDMAHTATNAGALEVRLAAPLRGDVGSAAYTTNKQWIEAYHKYLSPFITIVDGQSAFDSHLLGTTTTWFMDTVHPNSTGHDQLHYLFLGQALPAPTPTAQLTVTVQPTSTQTSVSFEEYDSRITYAGAWSFYSLASASAGQFKASAETGATASFSFDGVGVTLYLNKAYNRQNVEICIDDNCQTINIYNATVLTQQPYYFGPLVQGHHTVVMRNPGSSFIDIDLVTIQIGSVTSTPTSTSAVTPIPSPSATPNTNPFPAGYYEEFDSRITYSGTSWASYVQSSASGGLFKATNHQGDTASFYFQGTGITLYLIKAYNRQNMDLCIDNVCSTISVYDPGVLLMQPYTINGLASGLHHLLMRNPGGFYIDLDLFRIIG
jgi:lysophospholipase L1-like esterase